MISKFESILLDTGVVHNMDTGIMVYESNGREIKVNYLILEYSDTKEVYLYKFDDTNPPYHDVLAKGMSECLEIARELAILDLNKQIKNYH